MSRPWTDRELDSALRDLAAAAVYPAPSALAVAVGDRLRAEARPQPAHPVRGPAWPAWLRTPRRAVVAAVLVLVIALSAVLTFSPAARHAVARWLGLEGARIQTVPTLPPVPSIGPSPIDLLLGERVTLAEARDRAAFDLVLPSVLGPPDAVFLDDRLPGGRISMGWRPTAELPVSEHTGYGLLLSQFRGSQDQAWLQKYIPQGEAIQPVTVDGEPGYWIGLTDHVLLYLTADGDTREDTLRLAGPTLLWERDGLLVRLEGELDRATALRIARSVR
jgi:hypothetical protein